MMEQNQARAAMKTEIQHFAIEKVSKNDNVYGVTWGNVVREYLNTAYAGESAQAEVVLDNVTYKVLKRDSVTSFYDADGNTLFDVENRRLEKEYEFVMKETANPENSECQIAKQIEETGEDDLKCSGGIDEKCKDCEKASKKEEQAEMKDTGVVISKMETTTEPAVIEPPAEGKAEPSAADAVAKLEKEKAKAKDGNFATPIIDYLIGRVNEDAGLVSDVLQEHKTWDKCFSYIRENARKQAKNGFVAIGNDVVFEWAEDYYHLDDKAVEEKKRKEAEERKKRQKENAKNSKEKKVKQKAAKPKEENNTVVKAQTEKPDKPTQRNKGKELEGQFSIFDLM